LLLTGWLVDLKALINGLIIASSFSENELFANTCITIEKLKTQTKAVLSNVFIDDLFIIHQLAYRRALRKNASKSE
jgi:hypothetical protein